jgi:hypothetical protein
MKLLSIIYLRLQAIIGKIWLITFLLVTIFFSFFVVDRITSPTEVTSLNLAVVDNDNSQLSNEIIANLYALDGITIKNTNYANAQLLLVRGQVEGIFVIDYGYEEALIYGREQVLPIRYESSSAIATRTAAREIIAGQIITQRSLQRARGELITANVSFLEEELESMLALFNENAQPLYHFTVFSGATGYITRTFGEIFAGYLGFVSLVIIILMMTLSQWFAKQDSRGVAKRMLVLPNGRLLSFLGDTLLLSVVGIVVILLAYLVSFSFTIFEILYLFAYVYSIAGLCLILSSFQESGSIDIMAPLIALFTSILGGSFMDLGDLSPVMHTLALLTPQGQLLSGVSGNSLWNLCIMVGIGTILLGIYYYSNKKRESH